MTGDFLFERTTTNASHTVVTVAASNLSFNLGSLTHNILNITNGSGVFIISPDGLAGQGSVNVAINVSGVGLSGSFGLRINKTNSAIDETVDIGGSSQHLDLPAGPYLQINGTGVVLTVFGISMTGDYSFEQKQTANNAQLVTVQANNVNFNFGTSIITATNGQALFLISDGGMAGQGSITIGVSAFGGISHPFTLAFNNMSTPVSDTVTPGPAPGAAPSPLPGGSGSPAALPLPFSPQSLDVPSGPFNRLSSGGPIGISVNVAGSPQSITGAFVLTLVHPDNNPAHDYVTVGVSGLSLTLGGGAVTMAVGGGTGAFVIYTATPSKLAGEVTVATATLGGAAAVSIGVTNVKVRLNNTSADVGTPGHPVVVSVSANHADDVSLLFVGPYYRDYLSVSGAAELTLTGFPTLGGNFAFERSNSDPNQLKVSVTDLHLDLKAGSFTVASFNHGTGAFVIGSGGIAGVASLEFQTGIVGISGTIGLELNTTNSAVNTSVLTPTGSTLINLTNTHYVKVTVHGYLHLGSVALPVDLEVIITPTPVECWG